MKKFFILFKKTSGKIFRIFLFLIASLIILFFFPKEGKFRYEYQKGSPWLHETLIAPYDFPVYKLDKELKKEKDSILNEIKPYFKYDSQIPYNQMDSFRNVFSKKWEHDIKLYDSLQNKKKDKLISSKRKEKYYQKLEKKYEEEIIGELEFIYEKGIIEIPENLENINLDDNSIVIVKNNIAEEYDIFEVFMPKTSYEYLLRFAKKTRKKWKDNDSKLIGINTQFFTKLNLNDFLQANIFYDNATTEKMQKILVEQVSLSRGMVQKGERIIANGDIVTHEKFRILESLRREYELSLGTSKNFYIILAGQYILILLTFLMLYVFLYHFRYDILESNSQTIFVLFLPVLMVTFTYLVNKSNVLSIYIIPYTILPIIVRTFYTSRFAWFIHITTMLIIGFIVPNGFEFVFMQSIAGIAAIFTLGKINRQWQLFITAFLIALTYSTTYLGIAIMQEGNLSKIDWLHYAWFAGNALLILTSYPLIFLFEKMFGFLSDITLMELSDTNHPLLRRLAQETPGTFQHSMQVANLAEEVVFQIGGNPLLVRAGAYFHDIGKIENPNFFTENQTSNNNPHDKLEFEKSAEIIINHVTNGIKLAQKENLPNQLIDFIRTHHGTTKVQYFLRSMKNKYPDKKIDEEKFTYHGIKPYSKETAVLMMADVIEAASRSLKEYTDENISNLVENLINFKIAEEQLTESNITFKDISTIKKIFKEKLKTIYHGRIVYPENNNK